MAYVDGETFKTYCDKPYDRHVYHLHKNGETYEFEDYEMMKYYWYQWRKEVTTVEVVDVPKKRGPAKGF